MKRLVPVKKRRTGKPRRGRVTNPDFLAWIRTLPCVCCFSAYYRGGIFTHEIDIIEKSRQPSRTEAAHTGMHSFAAKSDDVTAIPLCGYLHHREGPASYHVLGKKFWSYWSIDRKELNAALWKRFQEETGKGETS